VKIVPFPPNCTMFTEKHNFCSIETAQSRVIRVTGTGNDLDGSGSVQ
jgi:hypothetical protein